jgi:hypothetical protein
MRESAPDRQRDVQSHFGGHRLSALGGSADDLGPGRPLDELHRHVELATLFSEVEDLHQIGVRELRGETRLVDEHRDEFGVGGELRQDAL